MYFEVGCMKGAHRQFRGQTPWRHRALRGRESSWLCPKHGGGVEREHAPHGYNRREGAGNERDDRDAGQNLRCEQHTQARKPSRASKKQPSPTRYPVTANDQA